MSRVFSILCMLLVWGAVGAANASSKPGLSAPDIRAYGELPSISMLALSPSGQRIAYRMHQDGKHYAVVFSLKENRLIASLDLEEITPKRMHFATENELVLIGSVVRRLMGYRDKVDWSAGYAFNIQKNKVRPLLTPGDEIYQYQTGLGRIIGLSPDKKFVYMPALVPDSRNDYSPRRSLMAVELDSPGRPKVHFKGRNSSKDFLVDKQGEVIVHELFDQERNLHRILARRGEEWAEVYRNETEIQEVDLVGLTPDMQSIVLTGYSAGSRRSELYMLDIATSELIEVSDGATKLDVDHVYYGLNREVLGIRYAGFSPTYQFFDRNLNQRMSEILSVFPEHSVWLRDWSDDRKHLVVYVEGSQVVGSYYKFSVGEPPQHIADQRPNIVADDINPIGKIHLAARDGLTIPTLLTIPRDRVESMKNLPAVMMPHGGPASFDKLGFNYKAQALASRGYLVIQPQFRGSKGFGLDHYLAGQGEWGKKMQDDLTDALAALVDRGMVNPERVCIVGASYGGYAALAGGAYTPELYRCVVSINGVSDLDEMLRDEKRQHGKEHWVVAYWGQQMADGEATRERLREVSPAFYAEAFHAPVMLIHGEDDMTVPLEQSRIMRKKLKRAKKAVQLIELEGETHHLVKSETRLQMLESMVSFVDEHLQVENPVH